MKRYIFPIVAATLLPSIATAITVNGDATVVILNAITATQTQTMNFGRVLPGTTDGTVVLSAAGTATGTGVSTYGSANAGGFDISAQPSTQLNVTFGNGTVTSESHSMSIDTFTISPTTPTTSTGGLLTLKVGATLHVGANQAPGTYIGTYTITVNY